MLSPITEKQFVQLQERYPDAMLQELPSRAALVTLPNMSLPAGWTPSVTTLRFIVPAGYPGPVPDCFWSDIELHVNGPGVPKASRPSQRIPEVNLPAHWFSWHVIDATRNWNPNRDSLLTYVGIIFDRFRQLQ